MLQKILEKFFIINKFTQCKTSRTLKIDAFEIPDINILILLDQANSNSDPSQILILRFPIPRASLPPSPSLLSFTLANRHSSSSQSSSCSSLVSLFYPTPFSRISQQVLDIPNQMASQTNQIFYQAVYRS